MHELLTIAGTGTAVLVFLGLLWRGFIVPTARVVRAIADVVEQIGRTAGEVRELAQWLARYVDIHERRHLELEQWPRAGRAPRPRRSLEPVPPLPASLIEEGTAHHADQA